MWRCAPFGWEWAPCNFVTSAESYLDGGFDFMYSRRDSLNKADIATNGASTIRAIVKSFYVAPNQGMYTY